MTTCTLQRTVSTRLPTAEGQFNLLHYTNNHDAKEHLALVMGELYQRENVLVRIHSECFTGDVLGSQRCDCGEQLHLAMTMIATEGQGVVIYLRQEGRGIGLQKKLQAYNLQDEGHDTVDANLMLGHQADERTYEAAVEILHDLGVRSLRLLTNNPNKIEQLGQAGLTVLARVPIAPTIHAENHAYLATKIDRMRHLLQLPVNGDDRHGRQIALSPTLSPTLPPTVSTLVSNLRERALSYYHEHHLPFVTLSYAQSIDGSIAAPDGSALRISGEASMAMTHMLRAAHDAILVGVGTVLADNPRLTVRLVPGDDPQPIVLDSNLRTPITSHLLENQRSPWLATTVLKAATENTTVSACAARLRTNGADLLSISPNNAGQVSLAKLLPLLAARGIRSIMVEGGATVLGRFLQERLANAAVVTIAPIFVGGLHAMTAHRSAHQSQVDFAKLTDPQHFQLGGDVIYYGYFCQPQ